MLYLLKRCSERQNLLQIAKTVKSYSKSHKLLKSLSFRAQLGEAFIYRIAMEIQLSMSLNVLEYWTQKQMTSSETPSPRSQQVHLYTINYWAFQKVLSNLCPLKNLFSFTQQNVTDFPQTTTATMEYFNISYVCKFLYQSIPFLIFWSGSFAVQFGDHLRSWDNLRTRTVWYLDQNPAGTNN